MNEYYSLDHRVLAQLFKKSSQYMKYASFALLSTLILIVIFLIIENNNVLILNQSPPYPYPRKSYSFFVFFNCFYYLIVGGFLLVSSYYLYLALKKLHLFARIDSGIAWKYAQVKVFHLIYLFFLIILLTLNLALMFLILYDVSIIEFQVTFLFPILFLATLLRFAFYWTLKDYFSEIDEIYPAEDSLVIGVFKKHAFSGFLYMVAFATIHLTIASSYHFYLGELIFYLFLICIPSILEIVTTFIISYQLKKVSTPSFIKNKLPTHPPEEIGDVEDISFFATIFKKIAPQREQRTDRSHFSLTQIKDLVEQYEPVVLYLTSHVKQVTTIERLNELIKETTHCRAAIPYIKIGKKKENATKTPEDDMLMRLKAIYDKCTNLLERGLPHRKAQLEQFEAFKALVSEVNYIETGKVAKVLGYKKFEDFYEWVTKLPKEYKIKVNEDYAYFPFVEQEEHQVEDAFEKIFLAYRDWDDYYG